MRRFAPVNCVRHLCPAPTALERRQHLTQAPDAGRHGAASYSGPMTWVRHRPKGLSWTLLLAVLLILGQGAWRYTRGGIALEEDLWGLVFRVAVLGLLVGVYLRAGGSTTASAEGLVVHDGIRRHEVGRALVQQVEADKARSGAVALLKGGRRLELPGVSDTQVREVRNALRGR